MFRRRLAFIVWVMSETAVKTHLEHVYAKTGLRNRAELAAAVTQHKHDQS